MDNNLTTEEIFESAVSIVRNLPKEGSIKPSDDLKLKFYAYFKQATHGPNDTPKPRFYQIVEAYKWDAWHKLGNMSKEAAMKNYIRELKQAMDLVSNVEQPEPEDTKHFEDVLGKKFYDYWFNQWQGRSVTSVAVDTQSDSSSGSSMSMLEDTQSAGDGYKTPNSLAFKDTFTGELSDQLASAVLRLQHGLQENTSRVNMIEKQLKHSLDRISALENQVQQLNTWDRGRSALAAALVFVVIIGWYKNNNNNNRGVFHESARKQSIR